MAKNHNLTRLMVITVLFFIAGLSWANSSNVSNQKIDGINDIQSPLNTYLSDDCEVLSYWDISTENVYYWRIPNTSNDDFYNMRFTPAGRSSLNKVYLLFYNNYGSFSDQSGLGVDIIVWEDDGTGLPGAEIGRINVPSASMVYYPSWLEVDFSAENIEVSEDFHVGFTTVDKVNDNYAVFSDDGNGGTLRSSSFFDTEWRLMDWTGGWDIDVNFLIEAELCNAGMTFHVFNGVQTIQEAVDLAYSNDTIIIHDGIYTGEGNRDIEIENKGITILSENGPEATIIDAQGSVSEQHFIFKFDNSEDQVLEIVKIDGITFQGGWVLYEGGAVAIGSSTAVHFLDCIFQNNYSDGYGGAVFDLVKTPNDSVTVFENCLFLNNSSNVVGGGIFSASRAVAKNCQFIRNLSQNGGGIGCGNYCRMVIDNCTFYDNSATNFGAAIYGSNASPYITNSIIAFSPQGAGIEIYGYLSNLILPQVDCCDIYGNVEGDFTGIDQWYINQNDNFSYDPLFCDTSTGDLTISDMSVCVPGHALNPCGVIIGSEGVGCSGCDDADGDDICDVYDNCPGIDNPLQEDVDNDGMGDVCDACPNDADNDIDGDGICGDVDNCPDLYNDTQEDTDSDEIGDLCDNCPAAANNDQLDTDNDGIGDVCDECTDSDNDGYGDPGFPYNTCPEDNCYMIYNPSQSDIDFDGLGDTCDGCIDIDGDGYGNPGYPNWLCDEDNCPDVYNPDQLDSDADGIGDVCDGCCIGTRGNFNGDEDDIVDISDMVCMVEYMFCMFEPEFCCTYVCFEEADVDASGGLDIADIVYMVNYMFGGGSAPMPCE